MARNSSYQTVHELWSVLDWSIITTGVLSIHITEENTNEEIFPNREKNQYKTMRI